MLVKKENGKIKVQSSYSKDFVKKAHELNGKWEKPDWIFDETVEEALRASLMDIYGEDGTPTEYVTVRFRACDFSVHSPEIAIDGLQIAKRFSRDSEVVMTNDNAFVVTGGFKSRGGSARNPRIEPLPGTVIQAQIPKCLYEKHSSDMELVEESGARKADLLAEKEKLLARLAEIEEELRKEKTK